MILDIPKVFTAITEWLAVLVFFLANGEKTWRSRFLVLALLAFLIPIQIGIGKVPIVFWLPLMFVVFVAMIVVMYFSSSINLWGIIHCWATVFMWAEFTAAFEWQLDDYLASHGLWILNPGMILFPITVFAIFAVILYVLLNKYYTEDIVKETKKENAVISVVVAMAFWALGNLSYTSVTSPFSIPVSESAHYSIFYIRTLSFLCGLVLLLLNQIRQREFHLDRELTITQSFYQNQLKQYEISKTNIDILNRRYHDMKHQLRAIRHEEDTEKKNAELKHIEEELKQYEAQSRTGNKVLDTIITEKRLYCAEHQITMNCVIEGELLNGYDTVDICTIFGNALDNAIEYEETIEDPEKRMIRVIVHGKDSFTIICVENYCEENLEIVNGLVKTHKEDSFFHGYGMRNMKEIAQKNGGGMTFTQKDNWVSLRIILPRKEKETVQDNKQEG